MTKFQNFGFTILLVVAYVAMAIQTIADAKTAANVTALPRISGTFVVYWASATPDTSAESFRRRPRP